MSGRMFGMLQAMDRYATGNYGEDSVSQDNQCDWCGFRTAHLSIKPAVDGSGDHTLCRRCVARYNQEKREYQARNKKA